MTTAILREHHGNCHAFAHLFYQALLANDVPDVEKTTVHYEDWGGFRNRFWVMNVEATDQTYNDQYAPWFYATGDLVQRPANSCTGRKSSHAGGE
jgi:hypothetical protein